ncbi:MAG: DUF664 domain-containing protein [Streptosporangiales bacterium]|nr:DUF664 domain-containing protein [Streptosporangiales bacterium]
MGFTSPLTHEELPTVAGEREALASWLRFHRVELLDKLTGLDERQAAQRVVGSLTTLHGLVRHLTWVEHYWFVTVLAGSEEPNHYDCSVDNDADYRLEHSEGLAADVERFLAAVTRSQKVFAELALDDTVPHPKHGSLDVRWVMVHMIEEYAQHNGHADIIRELIDGTTQS